MSDALRVGSATVARSAITVSALFALDKALGLVRDAVIGRTFGASAALDAYYAAFELPDALFNIVAGLAMATMDIIKNLGEEPANFLDIGGGASAEKVAAAMRLILTDKNVKAILINVFGGITRCDEVAKGLIQASQEVKPTVPIVARLVGTNEEKGRSLLEGSSLIYADSLVGGAEKVIQLIREQNQ